MNAFPSSVTRSPAALTDYQAAGLPLVRLGFPDPTGDAGSSIYDVTTGKGRPGSYAGPVEPVNGTVLANLTPGKVDGVVQHDIIGFDKGLIFYAYEGQASRQHQAVKFGTVTPKAGLLFLMWINTTGAAIANADANCVLMSVKTPVAGQADKILLNVVLKSNANRAVTGVEVIAPGFDALIPSAPLLAAFGQPGAPGGVHQIGFLLEDLGSGNYRIVVYLDGQRIFVGDSVQIGTLQATADVYFGAASAILTIDGRLFRFRHKDAGASADATVGSDYRHASRIAKLAA